MKHHLFSFPLVNAHTHAAMIAFRGLAEDVPLKEWLEEYIWPMERKNVNPDFVYKNTKRAISEMKENGIKVFCDMYFFEDEVARAAEEEKTHAIIGEVLIDSKTPSAECFDEGLATAEKQIIKYKDNDFISVAVAPHAIYTVCENNLIKAKNLARKYGVLYHTHLAETKEEFDDCQKRHNLTPVGYMDKLGLLDDKTLLAHCVWVTDDDIGILAERNAKVAHCPVSNLKLGCGIAPVSKMLEKGVVVALGTDGPASSDRLDIWEAGKMAALLQKGINHDPAKISAKTAIKMMTTNGLRALDMGKIDGEILSDIEEKIKNLGNCGILYS